MESTSNSGTALQRELARMQAAVEQYASQLDALDGELCGIQEENNKDDVLQQIKTYEASAAGERPENIAAEDALDNIVRLQNQLKIVKRRNELLGKENALQVKQLRDRTKELVTTSKSLEAVVARTGWREDTDDVDLDALAETADALHEMAVIEQQVRRELKSAELINKKKADTLAKMQLQVEESEEARTKLDMLHNDVRVKQRECREAEIRLQRMRAEDSDVDLALVTLEKSGSMQANSVAAMEADREYLAEAVAEMKAACRRQDNVQRAQLARQEQLQARLDVIMAALRDMRLLRDYERNVAKSALVPSSGREEPTDVSEVLPEDEQIPIDTYRLLYKNNELMRTSVARKNMLVLEKESVVQAMEAKTQQCVGEHNASVTVDEGARARHNARMNAMINEVEEEERANRAELERLHEENNALKLQLRRRGIAGNSRATTVRTPPAGASSKKSDVRRAPVKK